MFKKDNVKNLCEKITPRPGNFFWPPQSQNPTYLTGADKLEAGKPEEPKDGSSCEFDREKLDTTDRLAFESNPFAVM